MSGNKFLQRHILSVSIGGNPVDAHAASFRLTTMRAGRGVAASLRYPANSESGNAGEEITVSLVTDGKENLYFSGTILSAGDLHSQRELILTDSFSKLCEKTYAAAYRKEKASVILDDILGAAEIMDTSITCPDVELARFSTETMTCRRLIDLLIDALKSHGFEDIHYFFDAKDIFHFGTIEDTGKNEGEAYTFDTAKNILRSGSGWIETLPAPIRHTQKITVNGVEKITTQTELFISNKKSRLVLYMQGGSPPTGGV